MDDDDRAPSTSPSKLKQATLSVLRPAIPLIVCFVFLPLLLLFSLFAGLLVWNNLAVGWQYPVYFQYGDGLPPYAHLQLSQLASRQPYDVSLHLTLPITESNLALGNFMASLTLSTPSNKTIVSVRRPSIVIPPKRTRFALLSSTPSIISLDVPLLTSQVMSTSSAIAKVELGRQDHWSNLGNGQGRELSVIDAKLRGVVRHSGIRGLGTRFPIIFSISASITFLAISFVILGACLMPLASTRRTRVPQTALVPVKEEEERSLLEERQRQPSPPPKYEPDVLNDTNKPRRRRSSKMRESSSFQNVHDEGEPSTSSPVRRRRSRLFDEE